MKLDGALERIAGSGTNRRKRCRADSAAKQVPMPFIFPCVLTAPVVESLAG